MLTPLTQGLVAAAMLLAVVALGYALFDKLINDWLLGLAALVGASDGELTVGQLVGAIAALFEVPADDLAGELLPAVRGLVGDGFLVPVG